MIGAAAAAVGLGSALGFAAPAVADPDTAFTNELNTYGIYGQKDYNAWIGKITCKRIATGVDANAFEAADFVHPTFGTMGLWRHPSADQIADGGMEAYA